MSRRLVAPLVLAMAVAVAAVAMLSAGGPASGLGDPVLAAAGDIASCNSNGDEATANLINDDEAVATLGDNAYESGTLTEYQNCYGPSWGKFNARIMPSVGDQEYEIPGSSASSGASGYFKYFGDRASPTDPPGCTVNCKGYYSYDLGEGLGAWHVVVLNSNCAEVGGCGASSAQGKWLTDDLAAHQNACTLAYWHHPRFTSAKIGNTSAVAPFWDALYAEGAEVVLNGHAHVYERFAPQDPSGKADPAKGIREFVVGTGGRSLNSFGTKKANSEVRLSDNTTPNKITYGVIKLTLHPGDPGSYNWQFMTVDGKIPDSGSGSCHGGSEPPPPTDDTTPPTVKSTVPASGATSVSLADPVTATFSEAMDASTADGDPSTINGSTFKLRINGSTKDIPAAVTYNAATRTATLDPDGSLQGGTPYKAIVTTGAEDLNGNRLDQNATTAGLQQKGWTFTTTN